MFLEESFQETKCRISLTGTGQCWRCENPILRAFCLTCLVQLRSTFVLYPLTIDGGKAEGCRAKPSGRLACVLHGGSARPYASYRAFQQLCYSDQLWPVMKSHGQPWPAMASYGQLRPVLLVLSCPASQPASLFRTRLLPDATGRWVGGRDALAAQRARSLFSYLPDALRFCARAYECEMAVSYDAGPRDSREPYATECCKTPDELRQDHESSGKGSALPWIIPVPCASALGLASRVTCTRPSWVFGMKGEGGGGVRIQQSIGLSIDS